MSMKERYHILPDRGAGNLMVFDSETGAVQYPACWQDLSALYHYLVGRGRIVESQKLLADSMAGAKPITNLVTRMSRGDAGKSL
ncbi:MAG TPA: hypothetical protein VIU46_07920 [Gallionellaceae bacterium]